MKKAIAFLLLTALCMTFLTSCDMSNGLIAKLFGALDYELIEPMPPLYEETDEIYNEYYTEIRPVEPPISAGAAVLKTLTNQVSIKYSWHTNEISTAMDLSELGQAIEVDAGVQELAFTGYIGLVGTYTAVFGYSVNGENRTFDDSFQLDPDPEIKEKLYMLGASYVNAYKISIPTEDWSEGYHQIDLLYHTSDGTENVFCSFEVYLAPTEMTSEEITEEITEETYEDCIPPEALYPGDYLTLDGDLSDWHYGGCASYSFDQSNLDAWVGEVGGKGFTMYTASDPEYVYFAFDVTDDTMAYSADGKYDRDAFQIQIDFNGWAASTMAFYRAIFYSFGLQEDGTMDVTVQCRDSDAASSIDYLMASDDDSEWREGEIKGVTRKKDDGSGWIAEFAISWETLYRDIYQKLDAVGEMVPDVNFNLDNVRLNMLICYLDHDMEAGIVSAWGTSQYKGALLDGEGWDPEGTGVIADYVPRYGEASIYSQFK